MELIGRRLSATELRALLDDPSTADDLLYGDLDDDDAEMPEPELDLDKLWHGVHYLLTGTAWDLGDGAAGAAILGGTEFGSDGGYGPPRLVDADLVRAVAAGLDGLDPDALRTRFDPVAMSAAGIYPDVWTDVDADDLIEHLGTLRDFYRSAAGQGQAVLLAIV
jgi:hypothetical protein